MVAIILICSFSTNAVAADLLTPEDLGQIIRERIIKGTRELAKNSRTYKSTLKETKIPILMFHHIGEDTGNTGIVSEKKFYDSMNYLKDNNYNTVSFKDLHNYVIKGRELPKNPIMITIDDGYISNYEKMFPILKANKQRATIFVIGSSIGKNTYKDTDHPIIPHFTMEQMLEMAESGFIDIGSHSYDMHQSKDLEDPSARIQLNALKSEGESEEEYIKFFEDDFEKFSSIYSELDKGQVEIFAYPLGKKDKATESILANLGIKATFTTENGINTLVKGQRESLFSLKRNNINEDTDLEKLLNDLALDK